MIDNALLKLAHILSSTVLFGTGLGIAFFKWHTDKSRNVAAIAVVAERVVIADWCFTTPAVILQAVTGLMLAGRAGWPLTSGWVLHAIVLYVFAGACWIPVVWLQIRMRELARSAARGGRPLDALYWRYARVWFWLGVPAFTAVIGIFGLMVLKPA
ncbi:MAG TPA: DUF2269 domain-containing protein [Gammaproteobacteria bacterium]|nr:DUF2269 domain-containing protein [Gammaproteobacteria bacterium]